MANPRLNLRRLRAAWSRETAPSSPRLWRRDLLLASVVVPAGINMVANTVAARMFGLHLFGLWLVWRSVCQLTANITPGFNSGLTVLLPRQHGRDQPDRMGRTQRVADSVALAWSVGAGVVATAVVFLTVDRGLGLELGLVALWLGTFVAGYGGCLARGRRDGKGVILGSGATALGAILCLGAAVLEAFTLFVWLQALRLWAQGIVQYRKPVDAETGPRLRLDFWKADGFWELLKTGFPLTVRGWVQTAAQYGDRALMGAVFGATIAGVAGLGSMLALPAVMLASTAGAWLLPILVAEGTEDARGAFIHEMQTIGIAIVGGALLLPVYPHVVPDTGTSMQLVTLSYLLVSAFALLVPLLTPMIAEDRIWEAALFHGMVIFSVVVTVVAGGTLGLSALTSLSLAVVVGFVLIGVTVVANPLDSLPLSRLKLVAGIALLGLGGAAYSWLSGSISQSLPVTAITAAAGVALGLLAAWRVFHRPAAES